MHKINKRQYRFYLILYPYVGVILKIHELLNNVSLCVKLIGGLNSNN